jgi:hypothetical protein
MIGGGACGRTALSACSSKSSGKAPRAAERRAAVRALQTLSSTAPPETAQQVLLLSDIVDNCFTQNKQIAGESCFVKLDDLKALCQARFSNIDL